MMNLVILNIVT